MGGAGYRTLATLDHRRNSHFERVFVMRMKAKLPFPLWLGRGLSLNPYLRGLMVEFLRKEMRPRELILFPDELVELEGMKDFIEWSCLRSWVKAWLKYGQWYNSQALSPDVDLESFFSAPIVNRKWNVTNLDLVRFLLLWKIVDMVALRGIDYRPPILCSMPIKGWIQGGACGTMFLVCPLGLNQPKAHSGIVLPGQEIAFVWYQSY